MTDLPPDLPRLRTLETWLNLQLKAVRARIAALEGPPSAGRRVGWWVTWARTPPGTPRRGTLHQAGCWSPGEPTMGREEAVAMLEQEGVESCPACKPHEALLG
ncbi:DUF6233 domain-containing protein [Streptomyces sp. NPDC059679]|uniref:DUF6233 domain-containing protein n=1 Tax=Streptomyces sp. NPDC059679 TaxID=3346903 RepID=UPI0036B7A603